MPSAKDKEFLGQGWAFPLQFNPRGEIALVSGETDIEQSIHIVLETMPGERVMRPEFGCRAKELVFAPLDAATEGQMRQYVQEALARWEPRIEVREINVVDSVGSEGNLLVEVNYIIKTTHDERSIVHPFYIREEEPLI